MVPGGLYPLSHRMSVLPPQGPAGVGQLSFPFLPNR
jgi:hypothetical protein